MSRSLRWMMLLTVALVAAVGCVGKRNASSNEIDGVTQDGSGRRVVAWIDPMFAMGPPHAYKSKHPGIAPDCAMTLAPLYADRSPEPAAGSQPAAADGYAAVTIPVDRQKLIGVKLASVERRDLSRTTRAAARIAVDERRVTQVHTRIDGFVDKLYVNVTGQLVRRGDPLLALYSPDILATQNELILAEHDKSELGQSLAQAARTRLLLWQMQPEDIDEVVKSGQPIHAVLLRSPTTGAVMGKNVLSGAHVVASDTLFEIADLSHVWAIAEIYETELPYVHVGSPASVAMAGKTLPGKVTFIGQVVESVTRTAKVRVEVDNRNALFKPNMYADVVFEERIGNVVAVPDSAVMQTGTRAMVLVSHGEGKFEPRQVVTGAKGGGFYEVRSGLQPGETVVAEANFLIDSESRLKAALTQLNRGSQ
jgi:Cu(I)/Ag(I) efflux system membrane fusion protein